MLEVKNLKKKFGTRQILDGVNFEVQDGEILSIVGPSGAGKTTLLRCVTGLESADEGEFLIDGKAFDPEGTDTSDAVIGVVFQVLKEDRQVAQAAGEKLLAQLDLGGKGDLYPYQLSGGQKQRVAIARALAMNPKILCYDEPTSALDPNLRDSVANLILSLKQRGMTQLVVTHDMEFAQKIADDVLEVSALDQQK